MKHESKYLDKDGIRPQMVMARSFQNMLSIAEKELGSFSDLSVKKIGIVSKFLDECDSQGLGINDFIERFKQALDICVEKGDMRSMNKLIDTWSKLMLSPSSEAAKVLNQISIALTQNNQQNNFNGADDPDEKEQAEIEAELERRKENSDSAS